MVGSRNIPVKLPIVGKQLSNLSLNLREPSKPTKSSQMEARRTTLPGRKLVPLKKALPSQTVEQKTRVTPNRSEESRDRRSESPSPEQSLNRSSATSSARTIVIASVSIW